jgi:hypothetical protein
VLADDELAGLAALLDRVVAAMEEGRDACQS